MAKIAFVHQLSHVEPLGIMSLSGLLKNIGHGVALINPSDRDYIAQLEHFNPDAVGYSVCTGKHQFYIDINKGLKRKMRFVSIFGGPHPTYFPEMIESEGVDVVCIGEGELALVDLVNNLNGKSLKNYKIENLWVKDKEGIIVKNEVRNFIADLDTIPFPDRDLVYSVSKFLRIQGCKAFMAGRGCPYKCSYCYNDTYRQIYEGKGRSLRYRSVNNVIEEIDNLRRNYPLKFVQFHDDNFIILPRWFEEFAEKYPKVIGIPYHCMLRANLITAKTGRLLAHSGCYSVTMSIESGDEFIRNKVFQRNMTEEQILEACKILKANDIKIATPSMIGAPFSTLEKDIKSINLNVRCKSDHSAINIFMPYPKTAITRLAEQNGFFDGNFDNVYDTIYEDTVLNIPHKKVLRTLFTLFNFFVIFRIPTKFIYVLLKFRPNKFFSLLSFVLRGYGYLKVFHYKRTLLEFLLSIKSAFKTGVFGEIS